MKKLLIKIITFSLMITAMSALFGCSKNITFDALIKTVYENGMLVYTSEDTGFREASISYAKRIKIKFEPAPGQMVRITALPEIRESYPVQITAVKIVLLEDDSNSENKTAENPTTAKKTTEYRKISAEDAKKMMDEGTPTVLDVRELSEYNEGHIEGALLLPYTEIAARAGSELPDKDALILIYCRSGNRSEIAAKELMKLGYTKVYDFGGINDWPYETVK